jgi:signal transduction histidine kinase
MARRRASRSISGPIIAGSAAATLTVAVLIGWIYLIYKNANLTKEWASNLWLLVVGILSFATIITVLVLFSIFLAREILEVRRQTTFIDSVTHELKSPLASIRLCLETLSRPELAGQQREQLRGMMLGDVERLHALIDDILQASRLEYGEHGHAVGEVDAAALCVRAIAATAKRHRMLPEDVHVDAPAELVVHTDAVSLELVVRNLIDNAIKYSEPPADVTVRLQPTAGGGLHLEVIDRGVGIPRRALKRVFHRFYRVDSEAVRARRGTGLGLYVAASLIKSLGGELSAESDGPGHGTRMLVDIPGGRPGVAAPVEPKAVQA